MKQLYPLLGHLSERLGGKKHKKNLRHSPVSFGMIQFSTTKFSFNTSLQNTHMQGIQNEKCKLSHVHKNVRKLNACFISWLTFHADSSPLLPHCLKGVNIQYVLTLGIIY